MKSNAIKAIACAIVMIIVGMLVACQPKSCVHGAAIMGAIAFFVTVILFGIMLIADDDMKLPFTLRLMLFLAGIYAGVIVLALAITLDIVITAHVCAVYAVAFGVAIALCALGLGAYAIYKRACRD